MAKTARNTSRSPRSKSRANDWQETTEEVAVERDSRPFKTPPPLRAQTEAQGQYLAALQSSEIVFAIGPAGTGKTYVAAAWAAQRLLNKDIEQIILTRPNVETGEEMGHLPGELEEKFAPYLAPFRKVMTERMGKTHYEYCVKAKKILPYPVGFMRGETFDNAVVLVDEAQNLTREQMKMILTRIGKNCLMVIDGDPDQTDIRGDSGLSDAVWRMEGIHGVRVVEFTEDDIVRNDIIKDILKAYRR